MVKLQYRCKKHMLISGKVLAEFSCMPAIYKARTMHTDTHNRTTDLYLIDYSLHLDVLMMWKFLTTYLGITALSP